MNDAFNHPQTVLVLGGTSEIAGQLIDRLVENRCRKLVVAGRDPDALQRVARRVEGDGSVLTATVAFDARDISRVETDIAECFDAVGESVDLVLVAVGDLGNARDDLADPGRITENIMVNFTWPAAALGAIAARLRDQGYGRIVIISSVAGVRIRSANFIYGAAKAGLDGFATGLAETLRGSGVRVHVVRPGFVHTKMTTGLRPAPFAVTADAVATAVLHGIERNQAVIWVPSVLRWVYVVLRHLPQSIWRRLPG